MHCQTVLASIERLQPPAFSVEGQKYVDTIGLYRWIGVQDADRLPSSSYVAGFFGKLPATGQLRIAIGSVNHTAGQFKEERTCRVSILANQNQTVVACYRNDVDPIGIGEHVIGADDRARRCNAMVRSHADPAIMEQVLRRDDAPSLIHYVAYIGAASVPPAGSRPAFDYVYGWGNQSGDESLSGSPASQQVFAAYNAGSGAADPNDPP